MNSIESDKHSLLSPGSAIAASSDVDPKISSKKPKLKLKKPN